MTRPEPETDYPHGPYGPLTTIRPIIVGCEWQKDRRVFSNQWAE